MALIDNGIGIIVDFMPLAPDQHSTLRDRAAGCGIFASPASKPIAAHSTGADRAAP
jgi:Na+-transporting methylmalonyl-CoA/oxaloacetate decarboxylase beta subunit